MTRARKSLCAAAVIGSLVTVGVAAAPQANADNHRRKVARTVPRWVAKAHSTGHASAKKHAQFKLYLAPRGGIDALQADVAAMSDPSSSSYRHYLTAAEYHAKYDATKAEVAEVAGYLKDSGLEVTSTASHNRYVKVTGTNKAVEQAFGVSMRTFRHRGQTVQSNTTDISVPAGLASSVLTVTGLDTTPRKVQHHADLQNRPTAPPPAGFRNARPCSRYYGQADATYQGDFKTKLPTFEGETLPYAVCGYTGPLYRAAYEGATKLDGTGSTVAVVDAYAAPTIAKDANRYASEHGDGSYTKGQLTQVVPGRFTHQKACGPSGWYGEETLDVEAVHAMAPGANIRYYGAKSCFDDDFIDALNTVVDENKASVVTNSWGEIEGAESTPTIAAFEQSFLQGAMQGISFTFSSGDNGDELQNTGVKQTDYPTSDPYVTSVGGTSDAIGSNGQFAFQTGWGTEKYNLSKNGKRWTPAGYLYGAGGGQSGLFNRPDYQDGVVPASAGAGRAVPDIALDADPTTGMLVGETQTFPEGRSYDEYRIGGTSLASPLFAGMSALREQGAGGRLGLQNPAIYLAAGTSAISDVRGKPKDAGNVRVDFANGLDAKDGLLYSIRTFNQDSSLQVKRGWDNVTGVGSPTPDWLNVAP